jgi:hypothetical protein
MEGLINLLVGFVIAMGFMQAVIIVILLKDGVCGKKHIHEPQSMVRTKRSHNDVV